MPVKLLSIEDKEKKEVFLDILGSIFDESSLGSSMPLIIENQQIKIKTNFNQGHLFEFTFPKESLDYVFNGDIRLDLNRKKVGKILESIGIVEPESEIAFYKTSEGIEIQYGNSEEGIVSLRANKPRDEDIIHTRDNHTPIEVTDIDIKNFLKTLKVLDLQAHTDTFNMIFTGEKIKFTFGGDETDTRGTTNSIDCNSELSGSVETTHFLTIADILGDFMGHPHSENVKLRINKHKNTILKAEIGYKMGSHLEITFAPKVC